MNDQFQPKECDGVIYYSSAPGENVKDVIDMAVDISRKHNKDVMILHNDVVLVATRPPSIEHEKTRLLESYYRILDEKGL